MEKLRKIFSLFLIAMYLLTTPATVAFAKGINNNQKAESVNDTVSVGQLENEGDIKVTKTVKPTDEDGKYTVTFDIEGKPVVQTSTYPLYAVVVFDTSGSMICNRMNPNQPMGMSSLFETYNNWPDNEEAAEHMLDFNQQTYTTGYFWNQQTHQVTRVNTPTYTAADGTSILCGTPNDSSTLGYWNRGDYYSQEDGALLKNKWENAVQGAIDFSTTLKNEMGTNVKFSLVTFASEANSATPFSNNTFAAADFGHPKGLTNLTDALVYANTALSGAPANAKKVILVISDGDPDSRYSAERAANNIPDDVDIYAIGYDTTEDTSSFLKNSIASSPDNYADANPTTVSNKMKELAQEVKNLAAGTNVTLTDSLTGNFSFNKTNFTTDKDVSFNLQDIASSSDTYKQTVSFDIYIDPTSKGGIYKTNDTSDNKVKLTYTDPNGVQKEIVFEESPTISWGQPTYTVNYYRDSKSDSNKLGDSVTKDGVLNQTVTLTQEELEKELIPGYKLQDNQQTSIQIQKDSSANVIDVIYVKDEIGYTVNYHYQKLNSEEFEVENDGKTHKAEFESTVSSEAIKRYEDEGLKDGFTHNNTTNKPLVIKANEEENVIDIYYVRGKYNYCIKYYKDSVDDNNEIGEKDEREATFEEVVQINDNDKNSRIPTGYEFASSTPDSLTIATNEEENVFKVLYTKIKYSNYTVQYYYDGQIDESKTEEYENQLIGDTVSEYTDKVKDGYVLEKTENLPLTIDLDETKNIIKIYYTSVKEENEKEKAIEIPQTGEVVDDTIYMTLPIFAGLSLCIYNNLILKRNN